MILKKKQLMSQWEPVVSDHAQLVILYEIQKSPLFLESYPTAAHAAYIYSWETR